MENKVNEIKKAEFYEKVKQQNEERLVNLKNYWMSLPKFEKVDQIPRLPLVEDREEWKNFYVVKLIESGAIPKSLLVDRGYYLGDHRNATVAQWDAETKRFKYMRTKFNSVYPAFCNHFEDDDGYALFVPIATATEDQFKRNAE